MLAVALLFAAVGRPVLAQWGLFDSEFDEAKKPWTEIEARLPGAPRPENLIAFAAGAATSHRFYIDATSLSVGEDGVVRYALLVRASGGAANVTFEGIRCATREQKLYALGRGDGKWVRARDPAWRRIEYRDYNPHHGVLFAEFFCPDRNRMSSVQQIIDTLRRESMPLR